MLEKLIEGRYIDVDLKVLNAKPAAIAGVKPPGGSFVDSTQMPLSIQHSVSEKTGVFSSIRTSGFAPALNTVKVHRNFQWLKWVPPYICQTPLGSIDILTGPMSGCWVITYKWPGIGTADPVHVGHLGTCGTKDWDDSMKAGWTHFAANNPDALISGFQPNRAFPDVDEGIKKGEFTSIFALVTPEKKYYAVKLGRQGPYGTRYRIVKVKECAPTLGRSLQAIF